MLMIRYSRSSLGVYSESRTAQDVTDVLGIEPTESHEKGALTRAGLAGRPLKPRYLTNQRSVWIYSTDDSSGDPGDQTGFSSLRTLVDVFADRADALAELRGNCDTVIWWSGDSDSSQGGFVIPATLLTDTARLGCDLRGTAWIQSDDEHDST